MAITQVGTTQQTQQDTASTAPTVTWPSGVQLGDYAVLKVSTNSTSAPGSDPTGFGAALASSKSSANQSTTPQVFIYGKVCDGTETGSLTVPTASTTSKIELEVWRGVDTGTPLDVAAISTGFGATTNFDFTVAPTVTGTLVTWVAALNTNTGTWSSSTSGAAETMDDASPTPSTGMGNVTLSASGSQTINLRQTGSFRGSEVAIVLRPVTYSGTVALSATATITSAGSVSTGATNYDGTATLSATGTTTSAGQVGAVTGSSLSATGTTTSAGQVGTSTGSSLAATDTVTSSGQVGTSTGASLSATATITSAGSVTSGLSTTAALAATDTITSAGQVGKATGTSLAETGTITSAGTVGTATGSSLSATVTITATGAVGRSTGATITATATITSVGIVETGGPAPQIDNARAVLTMTQSSAEVTVSLHRATLPDGSTAAITPNQARGAIT